MITAAVIGVAAVGGLGVAAVGSATAGGLVAYSKHKKRKAKRRQQQALQKEQTKHFELEPLSTKELETSLASDPNNSYILFELGGRVENQAEAKNHLQQAANLGHAGAAYEIGRRFLTGEFQPQCEITAKDFFTQAANLRHMEGMFALATLCEQSSDLDAAKRWYKKCAKLNHEVAQKKLGLLLELIFIVS